MKKLFAFLFIFAILALSPLAFIGGEPNQAASAENQNIPVSTAQDLKKIADNVSAEDPEERNNYQGVTITLKKDIQLPQSWTPIGLIDMPFCGTFDGNGCTISNLDITGDYSYQGLFGYTNGATIKNLNIAGSYSSALSSLDEVYAGVLVGNAVATDIKNCEINVQTNGLTISKKVTFGSVVGRAESGTMQNVVNYMPLDINFNLLNNYSIKIGGIAGSIENTKLTKVANFGAINTGERNNNSTIYVGGLAAVVSGEKTEIKDCVSGSSINVANVNQENYMAASVVANIVLAPQPGGISSVAYFETDYDVFAIQGSYTFINTGTNDFVMRVTRAVLYAQDFYASPSYAFEISGTTYNFVWSEDTSNWDFENDFVMVSNGSANELRLQIFQSYDISFAAALDALTELQVVGQSSLTDIDYGDSAQLQFQFAQPSQSRYYQISEIYCNGQELHYSQFVEQDGAMVSPDGAVSLSSSQTGDQVLFTLTVKATSTTEGAYSFGLQPITYNMYVVAGDNGGVRYTGVSSISKIISREITSASNVLRVEAVPESMNAFSSWSIYYLAGQTLEDDSLTEGQINVDGKTWNLASWNDSAKATQNPLEIQFATGNFDQSFLVMANFIEDPCTLSFTYDSTFINKIQVQDQLISESGGSVLLDKNQTVTIKIYANAASQVDAQAFENTLRNLFVIENASINATSYPDESDSSLTVYEYTFSTGSFDYQTSSSFTLTINASQATDDGGDNTVWIIVGVVGGVVVLAAIGLTLFFVLRGRGGGGSSKQTKNDDYKKFYY